jgi:hypothetical protein
VGARRTAFIIGSVVGCRDAPMTARIALRRVSTRNSPEGCVSSAERRSC